MIMEKTGRKKRRGSIGRHIGIPQTDTKKKEVTDLWLLFFAYQAKQLGELTCSLL